MAANTLKFLNLSKSGKVGGPKATDGEIKNNAKARIIKRRQSCPYDGVISEYFQRKKCR